jgi:methylglutaconyl-CoA hydratase
MEPLLIERRGHVTHITLNRPEVRNAFDEDQIGRITKAFQSITDERAVVLSGEGPVFCAGGDLNWMKMSVHFSEEENRHDAKRLADMFLAVDHCPCPVIALVHGAAYGGGLGLVCCADIAFGAEGTKFCFSEVKLGLAPAVIGPFAVQKIGRGAARRFFLTAEVFDAEEALRIGLVHRVMPFDHLARESDDLVAGISQNGPNAVREAKKLIREANSISFEDGISMAVESITRLRVSDEGQEGVKAFLEKRPPSWG